VEKISIQLRVNSKDYTLSIAPNARLLDVIREDLGLTGTKEGCSIGECGACTLLMDGKKVNSCMVLAAQADGAEILTIEGVNGSDGELHPLQKAFIDAGAVQCGFCTPGMIMSALELLNDNLEPTEDEIKEAISGNLCRCTGYKQIVDAVQLAARNMLGARRRH
jgi:aerobic carbon-monoxide dehydrogenase small subunit